MILFCVLRFSVYLKEDVLIDLLVHPNDECRELTAYANSLPTLQLSQRSICDLELLANGAFSPLDRFMSSADYRNVLDEMRLASGHLFPIPITLPVEPAPHFREGAEIALCDLKNECLAVMKIEEIYRWNPAEEADKIFSTQDSRHPLVSEMNRWGSLNISGPLRMLRLPRYYGFTDLRLSPAQTRARLADLGRPNVVAFQTRNPLHRAHEEMTKQAMESIDASLLIHPVVGMTQPGDINYYSRVRTYKLLAEKYYDPERVVLSLLPLAMRMAGPREALWHALIRRNYGANFLIVGRDHASPGLDSAGKPFYPPYAAQEIVKEFSKELGVGVIPFNELVYLPEENRYAQVSEVPSTATTLSLSGTEVRREYLERGKQLPEWYSRPEVGEILAETYRPLAKRGFCIWFTGLSGAGKSTIAEILTGLLLERGRGVTLLDGDVVRTHLSKGLGFSKDDRDVNIRRIGFVATEIVHHGGVAICAAVSPYRATRNEVRNMVGEGSFVEVFVKTPLEVCEARDNKGMYAKARQGIIKNFTGIDDPYEEPEHAELTLEGALEPPEKNARAILEFLVRRGFVATAG